MSEQAQPSATLYLASFAALLGALTMGLALGYTTPAFPDMEKSVNTTDSILSPDEPTRENEKSKIGSMLALGALVGGFVGQPSNKLFGRRLSLILFGFPFMLGWLMIALADGLTMVLTGRFIIGLCCGIVSGIAPTYVVEIAPAQIRGLLGTCFQVMVVIGILIAAVFGTFLTWKQIAGTSILAALGMSGLMLLMPETPQWLLSKGRSQEAESSLKRLRTSAINSEFALMSQAANVAQQQAGDQSTSQLMCSREFIIPFMLALGLMFFQQFSGINAVLFYQSDIFAKAAPGSDPLQSSIYVCTAQVVATIVASALVDKLGRKALLVASGVGHTISLVVFGFHSHITLTDKKFQTEYAWLPLVCFIVFISSFSVGYGPIPWMMIPEMSSARVRSIVASIATAFNWGCVYIVTGYVKSLALTVGDAWTYWIFSIICAVSCIFVILALPETKGKSPDQIQVELLGTRNDQSTHFEEGTMKNIA